MSILFTSQCLFHAQSKFKSPILLLKPSLFSSQRLPWKSKPLDGRWLIRKLISTICFVSAGPIIPSTLNVAFYIWRARGRWIIPSSSTLCTGAIFFFFDRSLCTGAMTKVVLPSQIMWATSYNFGDNVAISFLRFEKSPNSTTAWVGDEELWTGRIRVKAFSLWETQDISLQESPSPICFSFSSHTTSEQK